MLREIFREIIELLYQVHNAIWGTALLFLILIIIFFIFWSGGYKNNELSLNNFKNSAYKDKDNNNKPAV